MKKLLIALLMLALTSVAQAQTAGAARVNGVTVLEAAPRLYEKVELVADIDATVSNPYDPDVIQVDGEFTAPSGAQITVPGFYYRDYLDTHDVLTPTDDWSWRVRFTPTEVGTYQYQVTVTTTGAAVSSDTGSFTVAASDHPGFIRLDSRNPQYFAFDNGAPYFPIGEDMGWSNSPDPLPDYADWLGKLSAAGGNFVRVWMAPWGFDIEWSDTGLGNYSGRQEQAYQLDRVFDLLEADHVYMMLSLLNHGQFSTTTNPQWDQNPFNAANGGPCADPACFATNPDALRLWKQRLRYIAARWGYSTNIMAWEWWNEVNWTPLLSSNILAPWIAESASYLRSLDPYHHLITHEGSPINDTAVWTQDTLDFTQDHRYNMSNLLLSFRQDVPDWLKAYPNKPFLIGEFGDPLNIDNLGVFLHLGLWSAPMNGSGGSGMTWYWDDYVDRLNLYDQFKGIAAFFRDEDMAARMWQTTTAKLSPHSGAYAYGIQASDAALLWIVNSQYGNSGLQKQYNDALRQAILSRGSRAAVYSFEDGTEGWTLDSASPSGIMLATSTDQASDADTSLVVTASFTGESGQVATALVQPNADWSGHTSVSVNVYAPQDAADFEAQVYAKSGGAEADSAHVALSPGAWTTVTLDLSTLGDLSSVRELGVKIGSNIAVFDGSFYIDRVVFSDQPAVVFSFGTIEGASVTVTGLTPGSYTAEAWDTTAGTLISRTPMNSSDGSLEIALPAFTGDLAVKVKLG